MFKSRWWVVAASASALIFGNTSICVFATGVFIKPLVEDLHLGRGVISSAMGLENMVMSLATPFIGRLLDRRGFRPVLLPAIVLFAITTATLSLLQSSIVLITFLFAIQGLGGAGLGPTPYAKMVSSRFDDCRGLALGISLAGVGIGTALIPQIARILLRNFGWRLGYVGLACGVMLMAFIPVTIWFGEPKANSAARKKGHAASGLPGLDFSEAVRSGKFWVITSAVAFALMAIHGTLVHVVPLLTDRGLPLATATATMTAAGLTVIVMRIAAGFTLDKIFAPYVAIFFLVCPMTGIAILRFGLVGAWPLIGVVLLGMGSGAEHDIAAFMISRYFGIKAFGAMHGFMFVFTGFGTALGSMFLGWCFQLTHSYNAGLVIFEVLLVVSIVLNATLGPYRFPAAKREAPREPEQIATSR